MVLVMAKKENGVAMIFTIFFIMFPVLKRIGTKKYHLDKNKCLTSVTTRVTVIMIITVMGYP